ncbi:hypothetical protein O9993_21400 [Vibrio lentus]|nr:hypothetical protein [Vibrio lentus]
MTTTQLKEVSDLRCGDSVLQTAVIARTPLRQTRTSTASVNFSFDVSDGIADTVAANIDVSCGTAVDDAPVSGDLAYSSR